MTTETKLISLKQSPVIDYAGIEGIAELVEKRIKAFDISNQVATVDTVKSLKEIRAKLNNEFKNYEEQRKAIKTAIAKPYSDFESKYKELISAKYEKADSTLKEKILTVEDKVKDDKKEKLKTFFKELCETNKIDFVKFEQVGLNVTMSASEKGLKEQVTAFINGISNDLQTIKVLPEDDIFKTEVLVEYQNTLDRNHSIQVIQDRRKAKEEHLKRIEEEKARKQAEEEKEIKEVKEQELLPPPPPTEYLEQPKVEQQINTYEVSFKVKGTMEQLKELKQFILSNNIEIIND